MKTITMMVIVSLLAGCSSKIVWKHPNHDNTSILNIDHKECYRKAEEFTTAKSDKPGYKGARTYAAENLTTAIWIALFFKSEYKKCMRAKGYYDTSNPSE